MPALEGWPTNYCGLTGPVASLASGNRLPLALPLQPMWMELAGTAHGSTQTNGHKSPGDGADLLMRCNALMCYMTD